MTLGVPNGWCTGAPNMLYVHIAFIGDNTIFKKKKE
jgi:hypothetical protein